MALDLNIGGNNDFIDHGSPLQFDNLFVTGGTCAAWIRPRQYGGGANPGAVFDKDNGVGGWHLWTNAAVPNGLEFERDFSTTIGIWFSPANSILLNTWYHVAVTYTDGVGNVPSFYIDGQLVATTVFQAPAGSPVNDAAQNLVVGNRPALTHGLDGFVNDARMWRRILSQPEIESIYNQRGVDLAGDNEVLRAPYTELGPPTTAPATAGFAKDLTFLYDPGTIGSGIQPFYESDRQHYRRRTL